MFYLLMVKGDKLLPSQVTRNLTVAPAPKLKTQPHQQSLCLHHARVIKTHFDELQEALIEK